MTCEALGSVEGRKERREGKVKKINSKGNKVREFTKKNLNF
jgi:hypothetical protein